MYQRLISKWSLSLVGFVLVLLVGISSESYADLHTYGFTRISSNAAENVEDQLFVDVAGDVGGTTVEFTIRNDGPIASTITDVYIQDQVPLLDFATVSIIDYDVDPVTYDGVDFENPATPPTLPGNPSFGTYSADAENPQPTWGIDPGESLGLIISTMSGYFYENIIAAMNSAEMLVGLHVQSIGSLQESDTFVTPTPSAFLLGSLGLGMAGRILRRKRKLA